MKSSPKFEDIECSQFTDSLASVLRDLRDFVAELPANVYSTRLGPLFADASIGAHVRHTLDHVRALVMGARTGTIEYDHRDRGTAIEHEPAAALAEFDALIDCIDSLRRNTQCRVSLMATSQGTCRELSSNMAREIAFALSHTIHHAAILRIMACSRGISVPKTFGYAPATLNHIERTSCQS